MEDHLQKVVRALREDNCCQTSNDHQFLELGSDLKKKNIYGLRTDEGWQASANIVALDVQNQDQNRNSKGNR